VWDDLSDFHLYLEMGIQTWILAIVMGTMKAVVLQLQEVRIEFICVRGHIPINNHPRGQHLHTDILLVVEI